MDLTNRAGLKVSCSSYQFEDKVGLIHMFPG